MKLSPDAYLFALENTVDAVVITDMNSVIQDVNPAFSRVTRFSQEEAVGRKPSIQRSKHTTQETYERMWSVILSGGWWRGEIINLRKSGEECYAYLSISQIKDADGQPFAYVAIYRDITDIKQLQFQLKDASLEAIFMLAVACEAKDETTGNHVRRVRGYSRALALRMGLPEDEAERIGYSSVMHDVGKLHVPDDILHKSGALSRLEWKSIRLHPAYGVAILRDKLFYQVARDIANNHHEKWDGSGYPKGKKGKEIPFVARIVAVADIFDALTSRRPYKEPWPEKEALAELESQKGRGLDPELVEAFMSLYEDGDIAAIRKSFP